MNYWMLVSAALMLAASTRASSWRMTGVFLAYAVANALLSWGK